MRARHIPAATIACASLLGLFACNGVSLDLPGGDLVIPAPGTVVVEVFDDTDFEIDPRIHFTHGDNWFTGIFTGEDLATGTLNPGDLSRYTMDCDEVGQIQSQDAGQFDGPDTIGQADSSRTLQRGADFECGDVIQFHFIGSYESFGVVVSVNGVVVD